MGQYQYCRVPLIKRKDYTKEEIEKKYSKEELTRLVLFDSVYKYPPKRYFPSKLCMECGKNPITKEFQLSENRECLECYAVAKKENYDYIMKCIEEQKYEFEGDCILENKLYLGGIRTSFLKDELKKLGITHILMVGYFMTPLFPDDFKYENIEINDNQNENILKYLVKGIKFIEESQICYTHCQLGKSRSASIVIAYVMYKNKIHFSEAFDFVREKRTIAFPNEGFQWQLEDFDIIMYNFDYDLDKCDEFIQKFFENWENLRESEKEYLSKRFEKKSLDNDDDDDEELPKDINNDNKDGEEKEKEKKEENENEKSNEEEMEEKKEEIKAEEKKEEMKIEEKKEEINKEKKEEMIVEERKADKEKIEEKPVEKKEDKKPQLEEKNEEKLNNEELGEKKQEGEIN